MAMFAPIPLPDSNQVFRDVMDYMQQFQAMRQKQPLMQAQTQEAQANALKSRMFAQLINQAFGGAPLDQNAMGGYELTPEEKTRINSMTPGDSMVVGQGATSGAGASPNANKAKQMLYALGMLKETPEETTQREIESKRVEGETANKGKLNLLQAVQNSKKAQQLEDTADTLMQYATNNEGISNILDRNRSATGNRQAFLNFLNLAGDDAGEFNNLAIPMQAKLAKELSNRGGAVVAKLAAGGKYNLAKSHDYNTGIRKSTTTDIINTYDQLNDRYRRLTGQDLPQKLSPFYENWRNTNGNVSGNNTGNTNRVKWTVVNGKLAKV